MIALHLASSLHKLLPCACGPIVLQVRSNHPQRRYLSVSLTEKGSVLGVVAWGGWVQLARLVVQHLSLCCLVSRSSEHLAFKGVHRDWHSSWVSVHNMDKPSYPSVAEEVWIGWNKSMQGWSLGLSFNWEIIHWLIVVSGAKPHTAIVWSLKLDWLCTK